MANKRFSKQAKAIVIVAACVIIYNELISYYLQSLKWPDLQCLSKTHCVRILLVADAQIIGEQFEPLGLVARWDSDKYLSKTFRLALHHFQPHAIVYLGDLMDEGTYATSQEYMRYTERFFSIFPSYPEIKSIYLPGDNDIGGEGADPVTKTKLQRYSRTFSQPDVFHIKSMDIIKVNRLTHTIPNLSSEMSLSPGHRTRAVVTHLPLLFLPSQFVDQVLSRIHPQIIFSAHDHEALHLHTDLLTGSEKFVESISPKKNIVWTLHLSNHSIHEVMVPTCSYRMGLPNMGYGAAVMDEDVMLYSVLWLPSRFQQLYIYAGLLISLLIILPCISCCQLCKMKLPPTRIL